MKQNSEKRENPLKATNFTGSGMAIWAAIGMVFGLMLFESQAIGCAFGAALGLVIGAAIDVQGSQ
ncbi:MAG: hypothetical protein Q7J07_04325 [Pelolinea sp.]|nr:hypothetical protein [Pelolinea sp.]